MVLKSLGKAQNPKFFRLMKIDLTHRKERPVLRVLADFAISAGGCVDFPFDARQVEAPVLAGFWRLLCHSADGYRDLGRPALIDIRWIVERAAHVDARGQLLD